MRLVDVWLEGADGERVNNVEQGEQIRVRAVLEARREVPGAQFGFIIANADDVNIHEFGGPLRRQPRLPARLAAGQRVEVERRT